MKYHAAKSEDHREALAKYQSSSSDVEHQMYHLFKADKSCKWVKNFNVTSESKSSRSSGRLSGVLNWYST
jgi:hypothetical protein